MAQAGMITLRHLNIFVALYENKGNMTRTAETCYIAQPAISLALSEMEDNYGCRLFDRISRKLYINDAGTRLYGYARKVLNLLEDMDCAMKDAGAGSSLRVGSCDSMDSRRLPHYVASFAKSHPEIRIKSTAEATDSLIGKVLNNELDVAIIDRKPDNRKLVADKFSTAKLVMAASPELGFVDGQKVSAADLSGFPLLLREKGSGMRQVFDQAMKKRGFGSDPVYEGAGNGCVADAAIAGMGVALMPARMAEERRREGSLVILDTPDLDLEITYYVVYHKDKGLSENAADFVNLCRVLEEERRVQDELYAEFAARAGRNHTDLQNHQGVQKLFSQEMPVGTTVRIQDVFGAPVSA